jgi:hypothetical protein
LTRNKEYGILIIEKEKEDRKEVLKKRKKVKEKY